LTKQKSNVWHNHKKNSDKSKILRECPTKISYNLPTTAATNLPVNNDDTTTTPNPTFMQAWNEFNDAFNDFYTASIHFDDKYAPLNTATRTINANASHLDRSINNNDDCSANDHKFPAQQRHVFEELDTINHQLSQLLDKLENDPQSPFCRGLARIFPSSTQPHRDVSHPQQPAPPPETKIAQLPKCVTTGLVPPAPDPAPRTPGNPSNFQSTPTTIPNATKTVVCDCIPLQLPPPAPDPDASMVYDGASLWPPP